jgi:hypothetical protein
MKKTVGIAAAVSVALAIGAFMAVCLTGCGGGSDNGDPQVTGRLVDEPAATGESTEGEDAVVISNYVTQTTIVIDVGGNNNTVVIGDGNNPSNRHDDNSVANPDYSVDNSSEESDESDCGDTDVPADTNKLATAAQ